LNITLNNVVAVIPPSQTVPNEMETFSRYVNNVSSQTSSGNSSIRSASEENIFDLVGEDSRGQASTPSSSFQGRSIRLESDPRSILSSKKRRKPSVSPASSHPRRNVNRGVRFAGIANEPSSRNPRPSTEESATAGTKTTAPDLMRKAMDQSESVASLLEGLDDSAWDFES